MSTTNFPTSLDDGSSLPNPTATSKTNSPSHSALHTTENDAIKALEAKVGTGSSTPSSGKVLRGTGSGTSAYGQVVFATDMAAFSSADLAGVISDETGTGSLVLASSPTLTTPKITTSINDTNGNEVIKTPATGSAVNEITVTNAATGSAPTISSTGGDTNIDLNLVTKGTGVLKVNGQKIGTISSSSNLASRSQTLTASGSGTIAYSTNNPAMTLTPGKYLLVATASAKAVISSQDSSFNAVIYNDTGSAVVDSNGTSSTGNSTTIYPSYSVHSIVTPSSNTTYSGRVSQTFGTGATYTFVNSTLIAIPLTA